MLAVLLVLFARAVPVWAAPPQITSETAFTMAEGSTAVTTLTATDLENDPLTWSIPTGGGADADAFSLTVAGVPTFTAAPDYEASTDDDEDNVYAVTVEVSDGTNATPAALEVTVEDVAPGLAGPTTARHPEGKRGLRIAAYTVNDAVTWSLTGDDAAQFTIAGGFLRFVDPPDYENAADADTDNVTDNVYAVTVQADDGTATETVAVAVTVTDIDEPGVVTLSPLKPKLGTALTATLADPDTVSGTPAWLWERNDGREGWETIDGATSASYTPTAADGDRYLRATATYTGSDKTAQAMAPHVVQTHTLSQLSLTTTGSGRAMYPSFDPEVLYYAAECATGTWTLTLSTQDSATRLAVDGIQVANQNGQVELSGRDRESDIRITLTGEDGAGTTYIVHCFAADFPNIGVTKTVGATGIIEDLIVFTHDTEAGGYLILADNNGVPRLRKYFNARISPFHRVFDDAPHTYSVFRRDSGKFSALDKDFELVADGVGVLAPLTHTDPHDVLVRPNGDYVLLSYNPARRDFGFLTEDYGMTKEAGSAWGEEDTRDSVIQTRTPGGFTWNSWGKMAIEDCLTHRFPDDYAHVNSLQWVDGDIVASFRGCNKVLQIDPDTGNVVWRLGRSMHSDEDWAQGRTSGTGPAPVPIVNDPYGEFCGQHAAQLLPNGNLLLYDNGVHCFVNQATDQFFRTSNEFSRAVEYALDLDNNEAIFQRHHALHSAFNRVGRSSGHVEVMDNGTWLISWGGGWWDDDPDTPLPPDASVTQVDPDTHEEKFSLEVLQDSDTDVVEAIRAIPVSPVALAPVPSPPGASLPPSELTSIFHTGAGEAPQVVVAFSRPVADFGTTSPSLSVSGAEVASVSAHRAARAPANAYLVTLTPYGDGSISFSLVANQPCADGGICAADGTTLSAVPAARTIPGPVTVSFGAASYDVSEAGTASVAVELNRAHGRPDPVEIPLVVQTGSTATEHTDYTVPASVTFGLTEISKTVSVATVADDSIEGAETVAVAFGAPPDGVTLGTEPTTTVTIADRTPSAGFALTLNPATVVEGSDTDVSVAITNGVTFATAQTLTLSFSGTATLVSDYTVDATTLTLLAEQSSVGTTLRVVDDADAESDETIMVEVAHEGTRVAAWPATIPASDQPAQTPHISIRAGRNPVGEAEGASFTVTRTGETTANLTVAVRVTESGSILAGTPPTTVTFAVGQENVPLLVSTVDDTIVEGASETSVVTVAVEADTNAPPHYLLGSPASATVTVEDDDEAAFEVTVTPNPVTEGTTATVTVAITTGVTFPDAQTLTLVFGGTATQGTDYTVGATTLTLTAGETSVTTALTVLDDGAEEPVETLEITAQHGGQAVGQATLTIAASEDTEPPTLEHAEVPRDGRSLRLTFSEPLDQANAPPRTATHRLRRDGRRQWDGHERDGHDCGGQRRAYHIESGQPRAPGTGGDGGLYGALECVAGLAGPGGAGGSELCGCRGREPVAGRSRRGEP